MSLSNNFPAIAPSLNLDFANVKALDPRITFARTTTATYYDGVTTAKAEENLLLQSQDFSTTWSVVGGNATVTTDTTTAPDGTLTADTLKEDSATGIHLCFQSYASNITSGVVTFSVFAKLGAGTRYLTIGLSRDITNTASATFDLSGGTSTQTQANGTYSSASATITAVAESFYRCTLTVTTDGVNNFRIGLNDTGTPNTSNRGFGSAYAGDDTSSIIIWGAQLEQRSAVSSYTPTTTEPITNYIPVLQTAASGVARFDHNPTTGESLGLLVEEQRTNLCLQSEDFSTTWSWTRGATTTNTIVAPDGTLTGDKLVPSTDNNSHRVVQTVTTSAGSWTFSAYFKKGEYSGVEFRIADGTSTVTNSGAKTTVDLLTGSLSSTSFYGANATAGSASIVDVGNDWYRVSVTVTVTSSASNLQGQIWVQSVAGTLSYAGDGYSGVYIWGAQLEAGAFPTSYIATTSASVTRNGDEASMTGTNFSSWFNNAEGSFYSEFLPNVVAPATAAQLIVMASDGTTSNTMEFYKRANADVSIRFTVNSGGVNQVFANLGTFTATNTKGGIAYKFNDFAGTLNSAAVTADTTGNVPSVSQIDIGKFVTTGGFLNGTIKKIAYYPSRLADAQLQALTS